MLIERLTLLIGITIASGLKAVLLPWLLPAHMLQHLQEIEGRCLILSLNWLFRCWQLLSKGITTPPFRFQCVFIEKSILWAFGLPSVELLPDFNYHDVLLKDSCHFRLLKLKRRRPFLETEATLIGVALVDPGKYDCISYVWGKDTKRNHAVRLNNKRYYVTSNVGQILRRKASFWRENYIWIDSRLH